MKRRILTFVLLLALVCPLAVSAAHADMDPNGLTAPAPETSVPDLDDWVDSVVRVLLSWLGV